MIVFFRSASSGSISRTGYSPRDIAPSLNITIPLVLLAFGSIGVGYWAKEIILSNVVAPVVTNGVKMIPLLFSFSGGLLAFVIYDFSMVYMG